MTMSDAAIIVLKESNRPMHVKELVSEIERRAIYKFGAKNPSSVLSGALSKRSETFVRTAPGTYNLKD